MRALVRSFLCLWLLVAPHPALAQDRGESIRVATYNAFLLSPFFKCFNPNFADCLLQINGETEAWANRLADTILADPDRFDILVFNEAWDEDAKSILVRRLRPVFPTFVRKLDADLIQIRGQSLEDILLGQPEAVVTAVFNGAPVGKINGEDSGLMLFAKPRFQALPLPDDTFRWGGGSSQTLEGSTGDVAFTLFEDCGGSDCFSGKGAGLVRLRDTASDRVWNVVFTHMQADYPDDGDFYTAERRAQFEQIEKMIRTTLDPLDLRARQGERLILMGDLNVAPLTTGQAEWADLFNSAGSFYARPLYDAWARTTSPDDRGMTNQNDDERLDYILGFPEPYRDGGREGPVCVQHMTVPTDFRDLESDHYMVHADLNIGNAHCSPQIALPVKLEPQSAPGQPPREMVVVDEVDGVDVTRIALPGQMQWLHVKKDEAGTYLIGIDTPQVQVQVYAPDDLTTPISRYNKATPTVVLGDRRLRVDTYVLPREFYIRVAGTTRTSTADYALTIRRNGCASKAEACILQPGQAQGATLTRAANPLGVQDEAWFAFDVVGTSDGGLDQRVTLTAGGLPDPDGFKATLEDFVNTSGIATPEAFEDGARRVFSGQMGDGSTGYLVIRQAAAGAADVPVTAHMDTSLRVLEVLNLTCIDETNPEFGSDDIFTEFTVDGILRRAPAAGEVEFDCDEPSDEKPWALAAGGPLVTFVDKVGVTIQEADDISEDDPSRFELVPALGADEMVRDGRDHPLEWRFEDGTYRFSYILRKRENGPVK